MLDKTLAGQLVDYGLSEKEASVYLTLLDSGACSVQRLAHVSQLNRSTLYPILDSLVEKGLVARNGESEPREYEARGPNELLEKVRELKEAHSVEEAATLQLIPELSRLSLLPKKELRVKFFEGSKGLKMFDEDLLGYSPISEVRIFMPPGTTIAVPKNRHVRIISPSRRNPQTSHDKTRFVPLSKYPFSSELRIYAEKIALLSKQRDFGVIIESGPFSEIMKEVFDLAWEEAGRQK